MSINERIKIALANRNQTQSDLARHMRYELPSGQTRISHHLRGEDTDSIKLVMAVSELTEYSLPWLLTGNENADGYFPGGYVSFTTEESTESAISSTVLLMDKRLYKLEGIIKQMAKLIGIDTKKNLISHKDLETLSDNIIDLIQKKDQPQHQ